jgi:hypothetical protein
VHDVTLTLTDGTWQAAQEDRAALELDSVTTTINRAINVHHHVLAEVLAGSELVFQRKDGTMMRWPREQILAMDDV